MSETKFRRLSVKRGLEKARALLTKNWTSGSMARLGNGRAIEADEVEDPKTCTFCAVGALRYVFGSEEHPNYVKAIRTLEPPASRRLKKKGLIYSVTDDPGYEFEDRVDNVIRMNDRLGQKATLSAFTSAIRAVTQ